VGPRGSYQLLYRKFPSFKNSFLSLTPKSGRIFHEFLNSVDLAGPKQSAGRNGLISSTPKSITKNGQKGNWKSFMILIKNTKLSGI
jgi:hypothetical protein